MPEICKFATLETCGATKSREKFRVKYANIRERGCDSTLFANCAFAKKIWRKLQTRTRKRRNAGSSLDEGQGDSLKKKSVNDGVKFAKKKMCEIFRPL